MSRVVGTGRGTVELRLPPRAESVALARLALSGIATVVRASPSDTADLKLAVSEVCTSVVQALDHDEAELVVLRYSADEDVLGFEVEHAAVDLDEEPRDRSANGAEAHALGLAVARAVTDSLLIDNTGPGARVVATKHLAREPR